jgi:hypothetical protein
LKTSSEEDLPVERTIAYLVPPKYPLCQIPVAEGKRPCKCRENRNNRKTLMYNIGGLIDAKKDPKDRTQENSLPRIIEGVTWLTPVPSIRRSDEYIPEYELYDSPYDNACTTSKKVSICDQKNGINYSYYLLFEFARTSLDSNDNYSYN